MSGSVVNAMDELRHSDIATQLCWLAADGSSLALVDAYLSAIEASGLNAYISVDAKRSRAQAQASDAHRAQHGPRPLEGIAIAVKDNIDIAGWRTTAGMATRRERPPADDDAECVARLRAAGAVFLGKLNMHEAALGADSNNPHYGACQHPQRAGYTPGGSSGGSGAAVAAGLCSAALGSDSMGSIRIPASYCGAFGLKPSFGAVSPRGSVVVSRRLDHIGPLTRSAADLDRLLAVIAGYDSDSAQSRPFSFSSASNNVLRIGVPALDGIEISAEVSAACVAAQRQLDALGHVCIALPPSELAAGVARRAGLLVCEADMLVEHADDWAQRPQDFSPALAKMLRWAQARSAADLAAADLQLDAARLQLQRWLASCDLLVWPTTPQRAFAFSEPTPSNQADLTCFANMAGFPALSLPLPVAKGALPIGLQLIGPLGSDRALIALAAALSQCWGAPS